MRRKLDDVDELIATALRAGRTRSAIARELTKAGVDSQVIRQRVKLARSSYSDALRTRGDKRGAPALGAGARRNIRIPLSILDALVSDTDGDPIAVNDRINEIVERFVRRAPPETEVDTGSEDEAPRGRGRPRKEPTAIKVVWLRETIEAQLTAAAGPDVRASNKLINRALADWAHRMRAG